MTLKIINSFELNTKKLTVFGTADEPLFWIKQVGEFLDIKNIYDTMASISEEWKVYDLVSGFKKILEIQRESMLKSRHYIKLLSGQIRRKLMNSLIG